MSHGTVRLIYIVRQIPAVYFTHVRYGVLINKTILIQYMQYLSSSGVYKTYTAGITSRARTLNLMNQQVAIFTHFRGCTIGGGCGMLYSVDTAWG